MTGTLPLIGVLPDNLGGMSLNEYRRRYAEYLKESK